MFKGFFKNALGAKTQFTSSQKLQPKTLKKIQNCTSLVFCPQISVAQRYSLFKIYYLFIQN